MAPRSIIVIACAALLSTAACGKKKKAEAPPPAKSKISKARVAWVLGSKLGITALGYAKGVDQSLVDRMMSKCRVLGRALGTKVLPLPKRSGHKTRDGAAILRYLLKTGGGLIGLHIKRTLGPQTAALFELAIKTRLLSLLYVGKKGDPVAKTLSQVIAARAATAQVPKEMISPLLQQLAAGAPVVEVMATVDVMHKAVAAHLGK